MQRLQVSGALRPPVGVVRRQRVKEMTVTVTKKMLLTMMSCFEMITVNETNLCVIRKALKTLHIKSTIVCILLQNL
jgi:hypothetical protein